MKSRYTPAQLLPHSKHMVLLDAIVDYDDHSLHAHASVSPQHILLPAHANALPAFAAIEIMAQGVAAWAGAHARDAGENVRLGFLLGTRKLNWTRDGIPIGTQLDVFIRSSWQDGAGMGVFECELKCRQPAPNDDTWQTGTLIAQAALNVYSPRNDDDLAQLTQIPS